MDVAAIEPPAATRLRAVDTRPVNARQAARALDHFFGFHIAPVHLRRLPRDCTAAHVQYAALRLIRERETEIESFSPRERWIVDALCEACDGTTFTARLRSRDGEAIGREGLESEAVAKRMETRLRGGVLRAEAVEHDEIARDPAPPFTTPELLQDASRKLGLGVRETTRLARSLYEGVRLDGAKAGLVTYVGTDAVTLSRSAFGLARRILRSSLGGRYLPDRAGGERPRGRGARDAQAIIRPTDFARLPQAVARRVGPDEARLYELIWRRAVASQMSPARFDRIRVRLASASGDVGLVASGSATSFDGYLRMYRRGREDAVEDGAQRRLPHVATGETVHVLDVRTTKRMSRPPRRHAEASLVRQLGELGIGDPTTHAAVVDALRDGDFVALRGGGYVPRTRGRDAMAFLEAFFARWGAGGCTACPERGLDGTAGRDARSTAPLRAFGKALEAALERTGAMERHDVLAVIDGSWTERGSSDGSGRAAWPRSRAGSRPHGASRRAPARRPTVPAHA